MLASSMSDTVLAIDTSTNQGSVCLSHNGTVEVADISQPHAQAAELVPAIEGILARQNIWYNELTAIATTIGPGSFTGLRIGLAVARGILFSYPRLTVHAVTTLECLAAGYEGPHNHIVATLKAGKGEIYIQHFERKHNGIITRDNINIVSTLPDIQGDMAVVGNTGELTGFKDYAKPSHPHAGNILKAVACFAIPSERALKPLYIRPPDAKLPANQTI